MSATIYVPRDSAALALGADKVAAAIQAEAARRKTEINIVRNGSRGMFWLEPLLEVNTAHGRMAYGPVSVGDVASLFDASFMQGGNHPLGLGLSEEIPYLKKQQRLTFARVGITDPLSLDDYLAHEGYVGLRNLPR
jgi:formate dehydrogenase iron-sulfur subunit